MTTRTPQKSHYTMPIAPIVSAAIFGMAGCSDLNDPSQRDYDVLSYDLQASFDWEEDRLIASEEISLILGKPYKTTVEFDSDVEIKRVYQGDTDLPYTTDPEHKILRVDLISIASFSGKHTFKIDYEAPAGKTGLWSSRGPDTDPLRSRVAFTLSEPDRGSSWLVGNHQPHDRASWAAEMTMVTGEDLIANGHRVEEDTDTDSGRRRVRYEINEPIPTYLMAFAVGELEHHDAMAGDVPISLWHRRGLQIDPRDNLQVIAEGMTTFENLMGPYPWDSYAVVLLPAMGGGIEHATVSFNYELSGQAPVDREINDHELAHQWMGDWVTISSFDDLWVKEGMAVLLAAEAQRSYRDQNNSGRLFGLDFNFNPSHAIRDVDLESGDKYTSGPYRRGAWLLSQIRNLVGENSFWRSIRQVLNDHALGSIDSETFIGNFDLSESETAKVLVALDAKSAPSFSAQLRDVGQDIQVNLIVEDLSQTLIAPMILAVINAQGTVNHHTLAPGKPLDLLVPNGGYLAPDESDIHPIWNRIAPQLAPVAIPKHRAALQTFTERSPSHQERGLSKQRFPDDFAFKFSNMYNNLDSNRAQDIAAVSACETLAALPPDISPTYLAWLSVVTPVLDSPVYGELPGWEYSRCGHTLPKTLFEDELVTLIASFNPESARRLEFLLNFDYGEARSLEILKQVIAHAPTRKLRTHALLRASWHTNPFSSYSPIEGERRAEWQALFRSTLSNATSVFTNWFWASFDGVIGLQDILALPILGERLAILNPFPEAQVFVICEASQLAGDHEMAWSEFQAAAQPWSTLTDEGREILVDRSLCAGRSRNWSSMGSVYSSPRFGRLSNLFLR